MLRRVEPKHKPFVPHSYQRRGIEHLKNNDSAALFLRPGMGKTATVLQALCDLVESGFAKKTLIVAPKRVCELVWRQEGQKWTQFRHLRFAMLAGRPTKEREALIKSDADIWLINPELAQWLRHYYFGRAWPFDTLVIDELTRFKNARSERSKALNKLSVTCKRRWGLTGTPSPNGYLDLFGQMLALDSGVALGRYETHYKDTYFKQGYDGFRWELQEGAAARIEQRLAPYVMYADPKDYLELPPIQDNVIKVELPADLRKQYKQLKADSIVNLGDDQITAVNAAAVITKLKQFVNGAVYKADGSYVEIHTLKIDALEELVEELAGEQLLVAYEYRHDLERLLKRFPDTPYLGGGVSAKDAKAAVDAWNSGKTKLLFAHPASAGHGLNLQESGAANLCWFSQPWDYELYDQFINRIWRQGTTAPRIMNHKIFVSETVDDVIDAALSSKSSVQDALLAAFKSEDLDGEHKTMGIRKISGPSSGGDVAQVTHSAPTEGLTISHKSVPNFAPPTAPAFSPPTAPAFSPPTAPAFSNFSPAVQAAFQDGPSAGLDVEEAPAKRTRKRSEKEENAIPETVVSESQKLGAASSVNLYTNLHLNVDVHEIVLALLEQGCDPVDSLDEVLDFVNKLHGARPTT